ncbi:MAG: class I SAM-dependent methyltransferase [Thermomicrobiales bacterium]
MSALTDGSDFDAQSQVYDARTGVPPGVADLIARAVVDVTDAKSGDLVVEIGAGTGEIGLSLARASGRYLGIDRSQPMLTQFRTRPGGAAQWLLRADLAGRWPVEDGVAAVVFASRVVHLLDPDHVMRETRRICRVPGILILGRVMRDPDSLKSVLRRQRRDLLQAAGYAVRDGEDGHRRVIAASIAAGGDHLGRQEVAEWIGSTTPATVIAEWEAIPRMGSVSPDPAIRDQILAELRQRIRADFGDLDRPVPFRERYVIDVVRMVRTDG